MTLYSLRQGKKSFNIGTINSKINGTPKGVYLPNSKLYSILALPNLLVHNNTFGGTIYFSIESAEFDGFYEYQKHMHWTIN